MNNEKLLHELLLEVRDNVKVPYWGICTSVSNALGKRENAPRLRTAELDALIRLWPKHSGWEKYPVSAGKLSPLWQFNTAVVKESVWTGEYGALRLELLDFLIEQTK